MSFNSIAKEANIGTRTIFRHFKDQETLQENLDIKLGEEFSKKGIMTESLISLIRYANKDLGISRIEAATLPTNLASRRLLEKCNFKYEGVGQYFLQIKGKWEHHILYANICDSRKIQLKK